MFPFPDKVYQYLRWVAAILMPATVTLVAAVLAATGHDSAAIIVAILAAVNTFIGSLVGVSSYEYNRLRLEETEAVSAAAPAVAAAGTTEAAGPASAGPAGEKSATVALFNEEV